MRRAKTRILDKEKGQQVRDQTRKVNFASIGMETSEAIHHESRSGGKRDRCAEANQSILQEKLERSTLYEQT